MQMIRIAVRPARMRPLRRPTADRPGLRPPLG